MAEGHMRIERVHTQQMAALLCMFANAHRDPRKGRSFRLEDFDPYARRRRADGTADDLTPFREMCFGRRVGKSAGAKPGRDADPGTERPPDGEPEPGPAPAPAPGPEGEAEPAAEGEPGGASWA